MLYTLMTDKENGLLRALVGDYQRRMILDMRAGGLSDDGMARYRADIDEAGRVIAILDSAKQDFRPDVSALIRATERLAELLENDLAPVSKERVLMARLAIRDLRDAGID